MIRKLIVGAALIATSANAAPVAHPPVVMNVRAVTDGDTFVIEAPWSPAPHLIWKVRVLGIDTPEHGHLAKCGSEELWGERAKQRTTELIRQSSNRVRVEIIKHDKFGGRFDGIVYLADGRNLGHILVREKLARVYLKGRRLSWC